MKKIVEWVMVFVGLIVIISWTIMVDNINK